MKIGILTHYNVNNQGALLQMCALHDYLCSLGHEVVILTYSKNFDFIPEEGKKNNVSIGSIPYYIKTYLFGKGFGLTLYNTQKYQALAKLRNSKFEFQSYHAEELDAVIIGSDEVYSIDVGINPMMYGHSLRCENTISYAPSFGRTTSELLKEEGCYNIVQSGLQNMKHLSARDQHTWEMIKELTGKDVPIVCDPVFLMDFDKKLAPVKKIEKPYLLVYSYDAHMKDESEYKAIQEFAKKNGLITVSAGTYHKWCDKNIVCSSLEWVEYFKNAEYVITDTFHGYVTALKTNRPTALFVRSAINAFKLQALMQQTNTEDREFNEFTLEALEKVFAKSMDYNKIEILIDKMAQSGKTYLAEVLCEKKTDFADKSILNAPKETFCSGCAACVSICPKSALSLNLNKMGFYEAYVDEDLCINCGKCQRVCSRFQGTEGVSLYEAEHYALQSVDKDVVRSCSSGGLAHELALWSIEEGRTVAGCVYNCEIQKAQHICVEKKEDLYKLKGSKYLQSDASKAFQKVVEKALQDKSAKFTVFGTPCQVAGFARVAEQLKIRDRVLLVEIFCHGVPSYHVWDMQLDEIQKKLGGAPEEVQFRYKKDDWHSYCIKAEKDRKVWYGTREKAEFWHVFFENVLLNDACMVCKNRREESMADIRLGDYWGHRFEKHSDGVSAVFALTERGKEKIQNLQKKGVLANLEAGIPEEMLRAQNMSGYERDKKHKDAINALKEGKNVEDAIHIYRKQFTTKQKVKRVLLGVSSLLPADVRTNLRKKNSSRYTKQSKG